LRAFADNKSQHQVQQRRKRHPDPSITIGLIVELGQGQRVLLGMHETPELVQLALQHMQIAPEVEHHPAAMLRRTIQPGTHGVLVNLHDAGRRTDRISFRQGPDRRLENRLVGVQIQVGRPILQ
jgi:hypothetical protein